MEEKTQAYYNELHEKLAEKYKTDPHVIGFIRGLSIERSWKKAELEDFIVDRLLHKKSPDTLQKYANRAKFLEHLSEDDFEYIVTFTI